MLLGGDFNNKAKQLLVQLANLCDKNPEHKVPVKNLVAGLDLDAGTLSLFGEGMRNERLMERGRGKLRPQAESAKPIVAIGDTLSGF